MMADTHLSLSPWTEGTLDIHHISTGRGNATLLILPDAGTLLIDAGAYYPTAETRKHVIDAKPDESRRPGEWIGRYAARYLRRAGRDGIDDFVLTHLHNDHMGGFEESLPRSQSGDYRLTGIMDVAEHLPVRRVIDRAFPEYSYPAPLNDPHQKNYRAFIQSRLGRGLAVERFCPGSASQIQLERKPSAFPSFEVRNLAANGEIWTGAGVQTRELFPDLKRLRAAEYPTENICSIAVRLSYGKFKYFTGGDLGYSDVGGGLEPWRDVETPVARAAGPVDVAMVNHHGWQDAACPNFAAALRAKAWIISAWEAAHPSMPGTWNLLNQRYYPGERAIYATAMKAENKIVNRRLSELRSDNGHVIVRVPPPGDRFEVYITTNADESGRVTARFGPVDCG